MTAHEKIALRFLADFPLKARRMAAPGAPALTTPVGRLTANFDRVEGAAGSRNIPRIASRPATS